jgi:hypothetical protein
MGCKEATQVFADVRNDVVRFLADCFIFFIKSAAFFNVPNSSCGSGEDGERINFSPLMRGYRRRILAGE